MNELALHPLHGIELFSGVGMLGEGLRAGLNYMGIAYRTICHVEREAHAASVLVARMEEGSMDAAPIWSDVTTFDARQWHGKVDCIVAGFPCQDLSVAGRRAGLDGARSGLFFEVLRIADDCDAWFLVLENVAGIASATATVVDEEEGELEERAAARVVGELADRGWDAEWLHLSASDVGASHGRERWFCIAWRMGILGHARHDAGNAQQWQQQEVTTSRPREPGCYCSKVAHPSRHVGNGSEDREGWSGRGVCEAGNAMDNPGCVQRCTEHEQDQSRCAEVCKHKAHNRPADRSLLLGDAGSIREQAWRPDRVPEDQHQSRRRLDESICSLDNTGSAGRKGSELGGSCAGDGQWPEAHESVGQLCGLFAPGPSDPRWADIIQHHPELAPALEPAFRRVVNGLAFDMGDSRAARLKCVGNGVVALCAATAVIVLFRRAGIHRTKGLINHKEK